MPEETKRRVSTKEEISTYLLKVLPDMRAFARSLTKKPTLADDLVQDAAVRILASAHLFAPGTNFKAWSFMTLRNCFYSHIRVSTRYTPLPEGSDAAMVGDQEKTLEMCEVRRAFWQLSPDHREAIILVGPAGMSYEDVAVICDCAIGTVKSRVARARLELKRILIQGDFSSPRTSILAISSFEMDQWISTFAASRSRTSAVPLYSPA